VTTGELYGILAERGLVSPDQPLPELPAQTQSPWYVQALVGFCAWIAGILLLVFLVMVVMPSNGRGDSAIFLTVGAVLCVVAGFLFAKIAVRSQFANQLALALSFGGQIGIAVGLGIDGAGVRAALWGMLVVEIIMVFAMRNHFQRFLSTLFAVVAWALAMDELLLRDLPGGWAYSERFSQVPQSPDVFLSVALWLVVWAPVVFGALWLARRESSWMADGRETVLRPVTHGLIASLAIAPLALLPSIFWIALGLGREPSLTSGTSGLIAPWPLLGASLALLGLALAFLLRHRPLMGLAVVFALLEISSFYYVLGASLLMKSLIMILLGAALLGSARGLQAVWK